MRQIFQKGTALVLTAALLRSMVPFPIPAAAAELMEEHITYRQDLNLNETTMQAVTGTADAFVTAVSSKEPVLSGNVLQYQAPGADYRTKLTDGLLPMSDGAYEITFALEGVEDDANATIGFLARYVDEGNYTGISFDKGGASNQIFNVHTALSQSSRDNTALAEPFLLQDGATYTLRLEYVGHTVSVALQEAGMESLLYSASAEIPQNAPAEAGTFSIRTNGMEGTLYIGSIRQYSYREADGFSLAAELDFSSPEAQIPAYEVRTNRSGTVADPASIQISIAPSPWADTVWNPDFSSQMATCMTTEGAAILIDNASPTVADGVFQVETAALESGDYGVVFRYTDEGNYASLRYEQDGWMVGGAVDGTPVELRLQELEGAPAPVPGQRYTFELTYEGGALQAVMNGVSCDLGTLEGIYTGAGRVGILTDGPDTLYAGPIQVDYWGTVQRETITQTTTVKVPPILPNELEVRRADGSIVTEPITWNGLLEGDTYAQAGHYENVLTGSTPSGVQVSLDLEVEDFQKSGSTMIPRLAGDLETLYRPTPRQEELDHPTTVVKADDYSNDHTLIQDPSGIWHIIGITGGGSGSETYFYHGTIGSEEDRTLTSGIYEDHDRIIDFGREAWAPHCIYVDETEDGVDNGLYYLFYSCMYGKKPFFNLATSPDLYHWTDRTEELTGLEDDSEAALQAAGRTRDVMIIPYEGKYLMYTTGQNYNVGHLASVNGAKTDARVALYESEDLLHWEFVGFPLVTGGDAVQVAYGSCESPYVFEYDGYWYLSVTITASEAQNYNSTHIFRSTNPYNFGYYDGKLQDSEQCEFVTMLPLHAPEYVVDENGTMYATSAGWRYLTVHENVLGGVGMAELDWSEREAYTSSGDDNLLFEDDFSENNLDKWTIGTGYWDAVSGAARARQREVDNVYADALLKVNEIRAGDLVFDAELSIGQEGSAAAIFFRADESLYRRYQVNFAPGQADNVTFSTVTGRKSIRTSDTKGSVELVPGETYAVQVRASGTQYQVYVDGQKVLEISDSTYTQPGYFGVGLGELDSLSWTDPAVYMASFDEIQVRRQADTTLTGIAISGPETVYTGSETTYQIQAVPDGAALPQDVTWTLEHATGGTTLSGEGVLTAGMPGTAVLKAAAGGFESDLTVEITPALESEFVIQEGQRAANGELSVSYTPETDSEAGFLVRYADEDHYLMLHYMGAGAWEWRIREDSITSINPISSDSAVLSPGQAHTVEVHFDGLQVYAAVDGVQIYDGVLLEGPTAAGYTGTWKAKNAALTLTDHGAVEEVPVLELRTTLNRAPSFPAKVPVRYSDGQTRMQFASWSGVKVLRSQYQKLGSFSVQGTVRGFTDENGEALTVNAQITVENWTDTGSTAVPYVAGEFEHVYHPTPFQEGLEPKTTVEGSPYADDYMNDHSIIQNAETGRFHVIGITGDGSGRENYFTNGVSAGIHLLPSANGGSAYQDRARIADYGHNAWAPHVIYNEEQELYYMFYSGRGNQYFMATSKDLETWTDVKTNSNIKVPLQNDSTANRYENDPKQVTYTDRMTSDTMSIQERNGAFRDKMVIQYEDRWIMYSCGYGAPELYNPNVDPKSIQTRYPDSGGNVVSMYESYDLYNWSFAGYALMTNDTATESPFVFEHDGDWYLSVTLTGSTARDYHSTHIFRADTPLNFGYYDASAFTECETCELVTTLPVHAPEYVQDGDKTYLTTCGWSNLTLDPAVQGGIAAAELGWTEKSSEEPPQGVLFEDDFSQPFNSGWTGVSSDFRTRRAGELQVAGKVQGLALRNGVQGGSPFTYEAQLTIDTAGGSGGLLFHASARAGSGYAAVITAGENLVTLYEFSGGTTGRGTIIAQESRNIQTGISYLLRVSVDGAGVRIYVDNMSTAVLEAELDSPIDGNGLFGLVTSSTGGVTLGNVNTGESEVLGTVRFDNVRAKEGLPEEDKTRIYRQDMEADPNSVSALGGARVETVVSSPEGVGMSGQALELTPDGVTDYRVKFLDVADVADGSYELTFCFTGQINSLGFLARYQDEANYVGLSVDGALWNMHNATGAQSRENVNFGGGIALEENKLYTIRLDYAGSELSIYLKEQDGTFTQIGSTQSASTAATTEAGKFAVRFNYSDDFTLTIDNLTQRDSQGHIVTELNFDQDELPNCEIRINRGTDILEEGIALQLREIPPEVYVDGLEGRITQITAPQADLMVDTVSPKAERAVLTVRIHGRDSNQFGLLFRYQDADYYAVLQYDGSKWSAGGRNGGVPVSIDLSSCGIPAPVPGQTAEYQLDYRDNGHLVLSVDGTVYELGQLDGLFAGCGQVGLVSGAENTLYAGAIQLRYFPAEEVPGVEEPVILTQPADQKVEIGESAVLTVEAAVSDGGTLRYRQIQI